MSNIRFAYLYRDASNCKNHGEVVFANPDGLSLKEVKERIEAAADFDGDAFIASQVRISEVFLFDTYGYEINENDHCYHEAEFIEETGVEPTDKEGRTIKQFVEEFEAASKAGWKAFDPSERKRAKFMEEMAC